MSRHDYHCSYDSNNPMMVGDVGLAGVAIDSVEDMKVITMILYSYKFIEGLKFTNSWIKHAQQKLDPRIHNFYTSNKTVISLFS